MPAAPARFTFDLDLEHRDDGDAAAGTALQAALLSEERAAGYAQGRADGFAEAERSAAASTARQLAAAASDLADRVAAIAAELDDHRRETKGEAVGLAVAIARKLCGSLLAHQPLAEIETLIAECLASLNGVPHLVIRCNPALADAVREIATARMATSGFTGRLVIMGEPEQALGDCRLEWVDGGIVRNSAAINEEIDARIAAFFAAERNRSGGATAGEKTT